MTSEPGGATTADAAAVSARLGPDVLRVRTGTLLDDGVGAAEAFDLDASTGNGDLLRLLQTFGLEGPLRPVGPWELEDQTGRRLVHAGSYAAQPFGEAYPPMIAFAQRFLAAAPSTVSFPQQSASAWRGALQDALVRLLAAHAPSHADSQVFLSNSGAEAVESALKFARAARPKATTFINFERAYHGKTLGALALTPNEEFQGLFRPLPGPVRTLPYGDLDALRRAVAEIGPDKVIGIVVEPVQGEAGVVRPPPGYLRELGALAREHGIVVIADEIQSGLGRTGEWFASVADGLDPDVVTLAKPLGGGLVAIGATIARRSIYRAMLKGVSSKRHSNTFGGGAFATAIALKSLELIVDEGLVEKARADGEYGLERLRAMQVAYPNLIADVRGAGMLFGVTLYPVLPGKLLPIDPTLLPFLTVALGITALHRGGVHACYSNNGNGIFRLTPPLTMPHETLATLFDRVEAVAARYKRPIALLRVLTPGELARLVRLAF